MGFNNDANKLQRELLIDENFTNSICYGETGSGKTTGYILPNIENRILLGHGVLVYDFKGTLSPLVKSLALKHNQLQNLHEIGTPWGDNINLLDMLTINSIRDFILSSKSSDTYWSISAANLVQSIYTIMLNFNLISELLVKVDIESVKSLENRYKLNFKSLLNNLKDPKSINNFFETTDIDLEFIYQAITIAQIEQNDTDKISMAIQYYENIKVQLDSISSYRGLSDDNKEVSGKYGVIGVVSSLLSYLGGNKFINDSQIDIPKMLRDGKIIIINLSGMNEQIGTLLNMAIYRSLQADIGIKNKKGVSIFIDEAQKVLTSDYLPEVDVCRESSFEYFFATQGEANLINKIGEFKFNELDVNLVEKYTFKNSTLGKELKACEYLNIVTNKRRFSKPLFIDDSDIFKGCFEYETINKIKERYIKYTTNKAYIIKYLPLIEKENKVLLEFENKEQIAVDFIKYDDQLIKRFTPNDLLQLDVRLKSKQNIVLNNKKIDKKEILLDDFLDELTNEDGLTFKPAAVKKDPDSTITTLQEQLEELNNVVLVIGKSNVSLTRAFHKINSEHNDLKSQLNKLNYSLDSLASINY